MPIKKDEETKMLCRLAQEVFGYGMKVVEPEFMRMYPDPRVYCFFKPGVFYWAYTYDPNNQAMMYRNGVDGEYAPTLPSWLYNIEDAMSLLFELEEQDVSWRLQRIKSSCDSGCNPEKRIYDYRVTAWHGSKIGYFSCASRDEIPLAIASAVLELLDEDPSLRRNP